MVHPVRGCGFGNGRGMVRCSASIDRALALGPATGLDTVHHRRARDDTSIEERGRVCVRRPLPSQSIRSLEPKSLPRSKGPNRSIDRSREGARCKQQADSNPSSLFAPAAACPPAPRLPRRPRHAAGGALAAAATNAAQAMACLRSSSSVIDRSIEPPPHAIPNSPPAGRLGRTHRGARSRLAGGWMGGRALPPRVDRG